MTNHQDNASLLARSLAAVWHPCSQMKHYENFPLLPVARGSGVWLYDFEEKRYLDAVSSWWVNLFGHCNPRINAALREQLEKLEHVMLVGFTHEPAVQLSERLGALAPKGLGHCFYASDGASATEIALKMSAHYWRNSGKPDKSRFISLENSYHGETLGALSVTDVSLFRSAYGALIRQHATVPSPDWRKAAAGERAEEFALRCADALEQHLQRHHAQLSAFIIEPLVQGATGMAMYHPVYLRRARQLCDEYGVHLIADEIAVGMGRTGTLFACEQAPSLSGLAEGVGVRGAGEEMKNGITPDFLCLSKGITGGYLPLSVVMTRDEIYQGFYSDETARGFLHSHSYSGNPLACRAALATLDIFQQDDVLAANRGKAAYMNNISRPLREHPAVHNWRNIGMIWGFEVDSPHRDFSQRCFALALKNELLLRPIGSTVYFMPPYVINNEEMDLLVNKTLGIINQLCRQN
ncbi:MAG: adenosylmethionine--8-amino-7-oxononanoate transaminase [Betaproteobacteria bacterium RBG_16_56_24]|nr:MAG: adenosylmethionine--8-amino-7-oxononanoate transaminase [Betaproteobacteria bacterium RBG_16_56_24]